MILAIDPGKLGGMAVEASFGFIQAYPMPDTQGDVLALIQGITDGVIKIEPTEEKVAVVEAQVGVMGKNSKASGSTMFKFGTGYGFLLGTLMALKWRVELVRPMKWQQALSLGTSKSHAKKSLWKGHLKGAAQRLYPNVKVTLRTADALLILEYAKRTHLGQIAKPQEQLL